MEWPFYDLDLIFLALFFLGGAVAGVFAFRMWQGIIQERRLPPDTLFHAASVGKEIYTSFQAGMVTLAAIAFTLVGGLGVVFTSAGKFQFRDLPINKLEAIEVYRAADEYNVDRLRKIRIENTGGELQTGLELLKKCSGQNRNHENFEDGYVLHLVFADPNLGNYYVSVFRRSSAGTDKSIVMPQREPVRNLNLGEYSCPAFQEWVRLNIEPIMKESTPIQ